MTKKRYGTMSEPEEVLGRVIRVLETDDSALEDPDRALPLLRAYHAALVDLLAFGPLACAEAIAREREQRDLHPLQPEDVSLIRAELLQLLRSSVRQGQIGGSSSVISTYGANVNFAVRLVNGRASITAEGDSRALIVLQIVLLLQAVGLPNVRECSAPDCRRLFVKVYRREFCSVQCQKRINQRKQRRQAVEKWDRARRRRTLQRIATEVGTRAVKAPQVDGSRNKNVRHSTRGNSGR